MEDNSDFLTREEFEEVRRIARAIAKENINLKAEVESLRNMLALADEENEKLIKEVRFFSDASRFIHRTILETGITPDMPPEYIAELFGESLN